MFSCLELCSSHLEAARRRRKIIQAQVFCHALMPEFQKVWKGKFREAPPRRKAIQAQVSRHVLTPALQEFLGGQDDRFELRRSANTDARVARASGGRGDRFESRGETRSTNTGSGGALRDCTSTSTNTLYSRRRCAKRLQRAACQANLVQVIALALRNLFSRS